MQRLYSIAIVIGCSAVLTSCFKDEAPNAECDITQAWVHSTDVADMFFNPTDTLVKPTSTDTTIVFNIRKAANLKAMSPLFNITAGATISPANGSTQDFSNGGVRYMVTSQDKSWHRIYDVKFNIVTKTVSDTVAYNFENYNLEPTNSKYYVWHDELGDGTFGNNWATGNPGFALSMGSAAATAYLTTPEPNGYDGAAVCLTTRSTGTLGALVKKPIAAGNLYLGTFDVGQALTNTLKSTKFGIPFDKKPIKVTGYYKYSPSTPVKDATGAILSMPDSADIYAVFYRNHDALGNAFTLTGDNVKTSDLIVGIAQMSYVSPTNDWTPFEITFNYLSDVDMTLLANRGYSFTLVFSSSKSGALFQGAIGSQLLIDKVRIISTEEEQ